MKIHREGYTLIYLFAFIFLGIIVMVEFLIPGWNFFHIFFYLLAIAALVFLMAFFRSPVRKVIPVPTTILAPADGKIVIAEKVSDTDYFMDERIQVSIFMSPLNVHVNWFPVSGTVKWYKYYPGRYLVAWHPKSSTMNERTSMLLETEDGRHVFVKQIAGAVARRIVCYARENKQFRQGEELGFIKFGSRVDLILPADTKLKIVTGQKVVGNQTIIGHFNI